MNRYPITCWAYYSDGSPILGNLDGQRSLKSVREMHQHYTWLLDQIEEGRLKRVAYWRFETNDGKVKLLLTR